MPSRITLMLLACASCVVGYLGWRCLCSKGVATDDRLKATHDQGERTMPSGLTGPEAARVLQWMENSPAVFEALHRMLHEYDQAREAAQAAQTERERLLQEGEALRDQVRQVHAELVRLQKERARLARWFTFKVEEAAWRFPLAPPPA